jgi:hypothetical protein
MHRKGVKMKKSFWWSQSFINTQEIARRTITLEIRANSPAPTRNHVRMAWVYRRLPPLPRVRARSSQNRGPTCHPPAHALDGGQASTIAAAAPHVLLLAEWRGDRFTTIQPERIQCSGAAQRSRGALPLTAASAASGWHARDLAGAAKWVDTRHTRWHVGPKDGGPARQWVIRVTRVAVSGCTGAVGAHGRTGTCRWARVAPQWTREEAGARATPPRAEELLGGGTPHPGFAEPVGTGPVRSVPGSTDLSRFEKLLWTGP